MDLSKKRWQWAVLAILAIIWGSSFILMKRGLRSFSSDQVAALRMFIAFVSLTPFIIKRLTKENLPKWKYFLVCGMFGNFIPAFLFTRAETGISSSMAGMLNSLTPLFTLLLGMLVFGMKANGWSITGIIIGFVGACGLLITGHNDDTHSSLNYGLMVVAATICYAISVNTVKKFLTGVHPVTITVWGFTLIGPLAGAYLLSTDLHKSFSSPEATSSFIYTILLAVFGTTISTILFYKLIEKSSALFASSVTYLIPIVAMLWGLADGENIHLLHLLWIMLILAGIYLVNWKK